VLGGHHFLTLLSRHHMIRTCEERDISEVTLPSCHRYRLSWTMIMTTRLRDDQLESQVGDVESEVQSESEEEEFDSPGEHCLNSEQKFQDQQYQANHAFGQFSTRSVFSATMATNGDSPQIVRIVELGPSPANPSAIITEDRHYPCPHLGMS